MPRRTINESAYSFFVVLLLCFSQGNAFAANDIEKFKAPYGYLACPQNQENTDRYRICEEYIKAKIPVHAPAIIFLRARLKDLLTSVADNRDLAYWRYTASTYVVLVAVILAFFLTIVVPMLRAAKAPVSPPAETAAATTAAPATKPNPTDWRQFAIVIGAVATIFTSTFNFNSQYKAEFSAYVALKALVDQIDTHIIYVEPEADGAGAIKAEKLTTWLASYNSIMISYAKAYSDSFKTISITDALKLAGGT